MKGDLEGFCKGAPRRIVIPSPDKSVRGQALEGIQDFFMN